MLCGVCARKSFYMSLVCSEVYLVTRLFKPLYGGVKPFKKLQLLKDNEIL